MAKLSDNITVSWDDESKALMRQLIEALKTQNSYKVAPNTYFLDDKKIEEGTGIEYLDNQPMCKSIVNALEINNREKLYDDENHAKVIWSIDNEQ
jgi:hypothetical protein